ncbi:hypothetical protein HYH03_005895 [Edaphochlamys debaryana]|uniref:Uncharacterized protein n=1 Tax=Edaphochlamys debaryana TaxID=47281 RepID=A0A835YBR6_9CHLO|nr:hypothetical protein HYH03_005895 [Edaphochlamys debaryana]|eukprot:KAG2495965.1 hypothetical protein HYH03_005895 [Edaphochlamys debaryana]
MEEKREVTKVNRTWQPICVCDWKPSAPADVFIVLDLGTAPAGSVAYLDDFLLTFSFRFINKTTRAPLANLTLASLALQLTQHDFMFGTAMEWAGVPPSRLPCYLAAAALLPGRGCPGTWPRLPCYLAAAALLPGRGCPGTWPRLPWYLAAAALVPGRGCPGT